MEDPHNPKSANNGFRSNSTSSSIGPMVVPPPSGGPSLPMSPGPTSTSTGPMVVPPQPVGMVPNLISPTPNVVPPPNLHTDSAAPKPTDTYKDNLHRAMENSDMFHLKALLDLPEVTEFIKKSKYYWNGQPREIPIHNANFNPDVLEQYLQNGADPDAVCVYASPGPLQDSFETLLGHAIRCSQPQAVQILLRHGADPMKYSWVGNVCGTAFDIAKELGHRKIVSIILDEKSSREAKAKKLKELEEHESGGQNKAPKPKNPVSDSLTRTFSTLRSAAVLKASADDHHQKLANLIEEKLKHQLEIRRIDAEINQELALFKRHLAESIVPEAEDVEELIEDLQDEKAVQDLGKQLTNALGMDEEVNSLNSDQSNWNWGTAVASTHTNGQPQNK